MCIKVCKALLIHSDIIVDLLLNVKNSVNMPLGIFLWIPLWNDNKKELKIPFLSHSSFSRCHFMINKKKGKRTQLCINIWKIEQNSISLLKLCREMVCHLCNFYCAMPCSKLITILHHFYFLKCANSAKWQQ